MDIIHHHWSVVFSTNSGQLVDRSAPNPNGLGRLSADGAKLFAADSTAVSNLANDATPR